MHKRRAPGHARGKKEANRGQMPNRGQKGGVGGAVNDPSYYSFFHRKQLAEEKSQRQALGKQNEKLVSRAGYFKTYINHNIPFIL